MKLYKYRSLENLWQVLDIVVNQRLFCATWDQLNDPLEGAYEVYRRFPGQNQIHRAFGVAIDQGRNTFRVASLSATPKDLLLWSHYAAGHRGVAIEIDFPEVEPPLYQLHYVDALSYASGSMQSFGGALLSLFLAKPSPWEYEAEYRILIEEEYFKLPQPVSRVFLGPKISPFHEETLRRLLPEIQWIKTNINTGTIPACVEQAHDR